MLLAAKKKNRLESLEKNRAFRPNSDLRSLIFLRPRVYKGLICVLVIFRLRIDSPL